ncbi:MAG TPA: aminotransferase class III-fold pyridoxal phosphate-dependent enzyme, partial [Cyclobacteriaceae bacterium]
MSFSIAEIKELITTLYQLEGEIKQLPGEIDLNYQLQTQDGSKYTFKIANPNEKCENLEFQNALMLHLLSKQLGLEIPQVIFTVDGELISTIKDKQSKQRFTRLLSWVEGRPFATVNPHTPDLLLGLGNLCGKLSVALQDFDHETAHRFIKWDLAQGEWIKPHWDKENDPHKKNQFSYFYSLYEKVVKPIESSLPKSVIYNDMNDYNVLVSHDLNNPKVPGVIDFGDAVYSHQINELAIALTYSLMHKPDPIQTAHYIVKGYHQVCPLSQGELQALFPLIGLRLLISVTCSRLNRDEEPDNIYLQISDKAAWELLKKLRAISPQFAYYSFREACGMEPHPSNEVFKKWCHKNATSFKPVIGTPLEADDVHWLDLRMGSLELGNQSNVLDGIKLEERIQQAISISGKSIGIGKYNEVRPFYTSNAFQHEGNDGPEWRTVHIGLDVFAAAEQPVFAPLDGVVYSVEDNAGNRNYGPTVILQHDVEPGLTFYTLYGHLSRSTLTHLKPGDQVLAGDQFSSLGNFEENGGWSPHLHFQITLDLLGKQGDFPGVALPGQIEIWKSICPNPWLLIDGSNSYGVLPEMNTDLMAYRKSHLGKNLSLSYHQPLRMERGFGQYLYDSNGRKYLDTVNNVAHVGHEHPRVVAAGQNQMAVLNTNTRYLHKNIINFTEAILETLPKDLEVAYIVNSGSEANELALRIAKTYTNQRDMVVVEIGYHGNTNACVEVSSYKFDRKGGKGAADHIHVVPIPDNYR